MIEPNGISGTIPPLSERDRLQGSSNAPIVIMKYGNYQCPQSGQAHITIKAIQQRLGDRLCFVFRHFPQPDLYPQSQKAAESAEAANTQSKFWQMHDLLFDRQQHLSDADLVIYADRIGLDISQFLQELTQHLHADRVQEDIESGRSNGVSETPTFFIGIRHQGCKNLEALVNILESNSIDDCNR
jgi:protein-disulfide isomerase